MSRTEAIEPMRVLCLFRLGTRYKLGGLGTTPPPDEWELVAKFAVDEPAKLTADGDLDIDGGDYGRRLSPTAIAMVGPDGWFGLRPIKLAKSFAGRKA